MQPEKCHGPRLGHQAENTDLVPFQSYYQFFEFYKPVVAMHVGRSVAREGARFPSSEVLQPPGAPYRTTT